MSDETTTIEQPAEETIESEEVEQAEKTPEEIAEEKEREIAMLREHDNEVRECAQKVSELRYDWERKKSSTAAAKKLYEEACEDLEALALRRPTFGPLFDGDTESVAEKAADAINNGAFWRDKPVDEMKEHGATENDIKHLVEAGINTMGNLADRSERGGLSWFSDIKGIGQAAAERIQDASLAYSLAHPELYQVSAEVTNIDDEEEADEVPEGYEEAA